jgi:predicted TIM-barrel fold metal-dependent hydrolase
MSADLKAPHSKPHFSVPAGACDCHMHVFGPAERYPCAPMRTYTPRPAPLADYLTMARTIGLERVVFVQPSAYGADNRCLLDAMREVGAAARGVIGMDETTSDAGLNEMHEAGVRGVRLNVASRGFRDAAQIAGMIRTIAERIGPLGWHLQLFADLVVIERLADLLRHLNVSTVFDHMALANAALGPAQPGFSTLLDLLSEGCCWTKLSGCYRISDREPDFVDSTPIARALIVTNSDRVVWGTDWPHTGAHGHVQEAGPPLIEYRQLDDGRLLNLVADWADDDAILRKILSLNPAQLYGF